MFDPAVREIVDSLLASDALTVTPAYDCPYLPALVACHRGFQTDEMHPEIYHMLMDQGFRRSGNTFYQMCCATCQECRSIRVPVMQFQHSKSQRRIWRRNQDVVARPGRPQLTAHKWRLYQRYLDAQHDGTMTSDYEGLESFLYTSPVNTMEICYYLQETLVGVSIVDQSRRSMSSVYMYYDPDQRARSLGTYSAMWEIAYCRLLNIPYYYLGYYVKDCRKMSYKTNYRPCEILTPQHQWVAYNP